MSETVKVLILTTLLLISTVSNTIGVIAVPDDLCIFIQTKPTGLTMGGWAECSDGKNINYWVKL